MKNKKVIIVGAGPSGVFAAMELLKLNKAQKDIHYDITMIDTGKPISDRNCPKSKTGKCMHCSPCNITAGFSGAGAFSDGKLTLSADVGGDLSELIGQEETLELMSYVDNIYVTYGADKHIEGNKEQVSTIRKKCIEAGLQLIDDPIRHLGTENARDIYERIYDCYLSDLVNFMFNTTCDDIILDEFNKCIGVVVTEQNGKQSNIYADIVIMAVGRRGAEWLHDNICKSHGVKYTPNIIDIGVRVEVRNEIMEDINNALYESKIVGYPRPFKDKVRIFCQNPGGYVAQENYGNNLSAVNGHSYKANKSNNTNLAILCSHKFTEPFNEPTKYARKICELTNMLGSDSILVQRYGDILDGKRTWQNELNQSNVKPTLKDAVAGDITAAMPYRTMTNIINFITMLNNVIPGFASNETLLYSPEVKFYSNKIALSENLETNIKNLYCIGDASGWTRGLMQSSIMGIKIARCIAENK